MLKQEETFRHQVHELHRLYRVQKVLVNDMKAEIKRQRKSSTSGTRIERWNTDNEITSQQPCYSTCQDQTRPRRALNLDLPAEECIGKDDRDVDEDSDLELTLATGSKGSRRKKENSFTSDSGASFSSSSSESGATKMKLNGNDWGVFNMGNYQKEGKNVFNVEEHTREERVTQPPWLFHCLSLNMT